MENKLKERIYGSGLFHFNSRLDYIKKIEILDWYDKLSKEEKEYIRILRSEASDKAEFFSNNDY